MNVLSYEALQIWFKHVKTNSTFYVPTLLWSLFQLARRWRKCVQRSLVGRLMFGPLLAPRCKRAKDLVSQLHEKRQWSVSVRWCCFCGSTSL